MEKMTEATKKVASGDFNVKLESQREDEIGELTQNFNQMVNELGKVEVIQKDFINNVSLIEVSSIKQKKGTSCLIHFVPSFVIVLSQ